MAEPITYVVDAHIVTSEKPIGGSVNVMSYQRLADLLRRSGEVRPGERLSHITLTADGIELRYQTEPSTGNF